ncbi:hypothetical protein [Vibrio nigripulchritudo]|uniref:hypothetical protein n=1 Tax=Vibrio nigripulchritudo TaxID=28173 RepID=UPI0006905AA9|nr:hypothetical protein [Vibrio nigripulchritudo]PKF80435.1 hypothetical protein CW749_05800 [Vibrio sp. vnigr-6D03]
MAWSVYKVCKATLLERLVSHKKIQRARAEAKIRLIDQTSVGFGWQSEWLTMIFCLPFILSFIPVVRDYILPGFTLISEFPEWYRWLLGLVVVSNYAIRVADRCNL